jgi:hypothetical protein
MIVLETEKAFDLRISNSEAEAMATPAHIVDWVAARVPLEAESAPCLSLATFHQLRRALVAATGLPRRTFSARTSIVSFATRDTWSALWNRVRDAAHRPDWPDVRWTRFIHAPPRTLRSLVELILIEDLGTSPPPNGRWTRSRIEFTIRRIILLETGRSNFRLSANFVRDIGIT